MCVCVTTTVTFHAAGTCSKTHPSSSSLKGAGLQGVDLLVALHVSHLLHRPQHVPRSARGRDKHFGAHWPSAHPIKSRPLLVAQLGGISVEVSDDVDGGQSGPVSSVLTDELSCYCKVVGNCSEIRASHASTGVSTCSTHTGLL